MNAKEGTLFYEIKPSEREEEEMQSVNHKIQTVFLKFSDSVAFGLILQNHLKSQIRCMVLPKRSGSLNLLAARLVSNKRKW